MALSNAAKAGAALFVGAVQFGILLIVSEAVSGGYSVSANYVSDLGASPPSASIFNPSIAVFGLLAVVAATYLHRAFRWRPLTGLTAISGVGLIGVGIFPEGSPLSLHSIFSLVTFLSIGLAAVVASRVQRKPLFYFSIILGLATLSALLLYHAEVYLGLGPGGMERMIVYPALLWSLAFSGHLMAMD
jgi:hypothetical membrane protein